MQSEADLPNVTLIDRVDDENLETFLSAYRKNVAGVSVPSSSRFYNLLAVGRPVVLVSEPDAEAALTVTEHDVGWVVTPGAEELARTLRLASLSEDQLKAERAAAIAQHFDFAEAMARYKLLIRDLLRTR